MGNEDELRDIMQRLPELYRDGDIAGYLSHYASNLQAYYSGASMRFEEARNFIISLFESGGKTINFEMSKPTIQFSENSTAAVISYTWRERFRFKDGKETDTEYYETDVWFKRSREWKIVNVHQSTVKEYIVNPSS